MGNDRLGKKLPFGLAIATLAACVAMAADYADTSEQWEKAYNAGDAAAIAALYTEDGVMMPPNAEMAKGKQAIQAYLEKHITDAKGMTLELETVDGSKTGDMGYARGTWRMKDASGKVVDEGKWIEVRKNVDGKWRIHRDIWNSDRPLAHS
jgi:uncharacterized protein (TIGR02246 family)